MSRYIDAETLVRWICGNKCGCERNECGYDIPCQQVQLLEGVPSIDIVWCKECKHNYNKTINHGKMYPRCDFTDWKLSENDYCSRGEREGE